MKIVKKAPYKPGYFPFIVKKEKEEGVLYTTFVMLPKYTTGERLDWYKIKGRLKY